MLHFVTSGMVINPVVQWSLCSITELEFADWEHQTLEGLQIRAAWHFLFGEWTALAFLKYSAIFISFRTPWMVQPSIISGLGCPKTALSMNNWLVLPKISTFAACSRSWKKQAALVSPVGAKWQITAFWSALSDRDGKADSECWQKKSAHGRI